MFKHSKLDAFLVILTLVQVGLLALPFFMNLSALALTLLVLLNVFLMGTNFQCTAHNFIHLPFFKARLLNQIFSIINSFGIAVPQSVYKAHHLNHHRFNNRPDVDESSTWRHGKNGKEESIFAYSFYGIFRTDLPGLFRQATKSSRLAYVELVLLAAVFTAAFVLNWKLVLLYLVPSYFGGHFFALWENYCEHHHADPYDRKRDSVSCYNPVYNLLWFNNGYHQEHHFSPMVHWSQIPKVRAQLPEDRVVVGGCHLTNSF